MFLYEDWPERVKGPGVALLDGYFVLDVLDWLPDGRPCRVRVLDVGPEVLLPEPGEPASADEDLFPVDQDGELLVGLLFEDRDADVSWDGADARVSDGPWALSGLRR